MELPCPALKEAAEERCCFIRDAGDLVRCLTIKLELSSVSGRPSLQLEKPLSSLRPNCRFATVVRFTVILTRGVCRIIAPFFGIAFAERTTPCAMRPGPPSFSLAKMKI